MFRPWGLLNWALSLAPKRSWKLIGNIGTEKRSLACIGSLARDRLLADSTLLRIKSPHSPYVDLAERRIDERISEYKGAGLRDPFYDCELLGPITAIEPILASLPESVILDITSLPKRYFFFLLKKLFRASEVRDLLVTYTIPRGYPPHLLSEDQEPWDALPSFRQSDPDLEATAHRRLVVNVGFMPNGLVAHLEGPAEEKQIDLLIPFPAPISAVKRSWQSVWALRSTPHMARFNEVRVGMNDMSEGFKTLVSLLPKDTNLISLAPFGPKPVSAAMCIYATITGSPVYYSQPKVYHPDYSSGVSEVNGGPEIYAYWVKFDGSQLYCLPADRSSLGIYP